MPKFKLVTGQVFPRVRPVQRRFLCTAGLALATACGAPQPTQPPTLDGQRPVLVAHRGASGYLPEETLEAYEKAITLGADAIEPDLISTQDGVLIARHDPNLALTTDVATRPEFTSRNKTTSVDGEMQTGWFASDFTLAEIKTLGCLSTDAERPQQFNGQFKIVTFQEILDLIDRKSAETGRRVAVYPETKNPSYHRQLGLPLEDKLITLLITAGLNSRTAPVYVQSFEPGSLKYLRSKGLQTRMVQLIDADDVDYATGALTYVVPYDRPYDWTSAGDRRLFSDMVTPAGLAEIKTYADGIGPWKRYIVSVKGKLGPDGKLVDQNGDGKINEADTSTLPATDLIERAHQIGLFVHPYTFRNEPRRLAMDFSGDPQAEYKAFYRLGIDGLFSDFIDTAVAARSELLGDQ